MMRPNKTTNVMLVNGEELIAMRAVLDQVKAELDIRKRDVDALQKAILLQGVEINALKQSLFVGDRRGRA